MAMCGVRHRRILHTENGTSTCWARSMNSTEVDEEPKWVNVKLHLEVIANIECNAFNGGVE